jgi:uncharacterized lipoprotein YddW (UPF0748 family)
MGRNFLGNSKYPLKFTYLLLFILLGSVTGCVTTRPASNRLNLINPKKIPQTPRELRGAWIATVNNIDWPSKPGLPVKQQKAELIAMLNKAEELHLNAVFFQVRTTADAFYKSPYEPWSYFLTGKQGEAPNPYYDPLRFVIKQAHKRGLELQAWFNPFRASVPSEGSKFAPNQVINKHPGWVVKYGKHYWLNPGLKKVRRYSIKVITDVVRRYDIDGVHMDDYFYPYVITDSSGNPVSFPDSAAYNRYLRQHGKISLDDWRRQNINIFVKKLDEKVHHIKPDVRFGISPFGIWRPGHPPQIRGYDAYSKIYADSRKWLRKGWVDYLAPQLYWAIDQKGQSFPVLLKWWEKQNFYLRHLWPGLYTSRVGKSWKAGQIIRQIKIIRKQPGSDGEIHFSMKALMNNAGHIDDKLKKGVYAQPALIPATWWLPHKRPFQPVASFHRKGKDLVFKLVGQNEKNPWLWVVKVKHGNHWEIKILSGDQQSVTLPEQNKYGAFGGAIISVVDSLSIESAGQMLLPGMEGW